MSNVTAEQKSAVSHAEKFNTTVVTCYYQIPSKRPHAEYEKWIANFMSLPMQTIIYCDEQSFAFLNNLYPPSASRIYKLRPIDTFVTSKWTWEYDLGVDHEVIRGHSIALYKIWNEKIFMVADAIESNEFGNETFAWVDIGCFRDPQFEWYRHAYSGFPDLSAFDVEKVLFLGVQPFQLPQDAENLFPIDDRFKFTWRIGGTMFAGKKRCLLEFRSVYEAILNEADSLHVFKGKDQALYNFCALRRPDLIKVIHAPSMPYDEWFVLHILWAKRRQ